MIGSDAIPQRLALRLQLAAIAGREPAGSLFEIRHKIVGGPGMRQLFHDCHRPDVGATHPALDTAAGPGRRPPRTDEGRVVRHYPPRKPRQRSWPARNRTLQHQFRKGVIALAGGVMRCQYTDGHGQQCTATEKLVAHHCEPGNPDPATGLLLCEHHHRVVDRWAR